MDEGIRKEEEPIITPDGRIIKRSGRRLSNKQRDGWLAKVSELYLKSIPQFKIAEKLGCTKAQITYDIKKLHKQWLESTAMNFSEAKAREIEKINRLEMEYWDSWERSKQVRESQTTRKRDRTTGVPHSEMEAALTRINQYGDPRFLQGIQWCVEKRSILLGLGAANSLSEKVEENAGFFDGLSNEERAGRIAALLERARTERTRRTFGSLPAATDQRGSGVEPEILPDSGMADH